MPAALDDGAPVRHDDVAANAVDDLANAVFGLGQRRPVFRLADDDVEEERRQSTLTRVSAASP